MLGAGVWVDIEFEEFEELSRIGLFSFCFAGLKVLMSRSGGVSKLPVSSLMAMLHVLI